MKKIYIAGAGGMLGEAFYAQFKSNYELLCTDIDVNSNWLEFCDFRNYEEYRRQVVEYKPDYLFHLGAHTDLEYCELHPDDTYATNTMAVENAVYIANELDIPLLYISTAGIFDGAKGQYDDWDRPNPICIYARSKYLGEEFVIQNMHKYFTCRAGWMMGGGPDKDKKFVNKIMKQIKGGNTKLKIVNDKFGTPTYTHDFARNVKILIEQGYHGLYNMVCDGMTSRLDVAKEIVEALGLNSKITIDVVSSEYFKKEYFAPRPSSEQLINKKLQLREINIMRDWRTCLREYLQNYYTDYL